MGHDLAVDSGSRSGDTRRGFLGTIAMSGGLVAGYGTFAAIAGRFLYPARAQKSAWLFVASTTAVPAGGSIEFQAPSGERIAISRRRESAPASALLEDFLALSSTCPHLGCQVHWQPENDRFFCPCHNGTFDRTGKATSGPPAEAAQSLPRFPLKVDKGLLFIEVAVESLVSASTVGAEAFRAPERRR